MNDDERMDFLESQFREAGREPYDRICLRTSITGRGLRLHHTKLGSWTPNFTTVREAIDFAISAKKSNE